MNKNYIGYTAEQLLNDDFFIQSELHPTDETKIFWLDLEQSDPLLRKEISRARSFMLQFKKQMPHVALSNNDVTDLWNKIQLTNKRKRKIHLFRYWGVAAAAITIFILTIPYLYLNQNKDIDYQTIIADSSVPKTQENVQLILSEDKQVLISEKESKISYDEKGKVRVGSEDVQTPPQKQAEEANVQLNKLIVPAGKRSFITLSDGTKIWVNSSTTIIYPNIFKEDKREIYVNGEAFLDVAHDIDKPFFVKTNQMSVRVLGTSFNVCAYPEDDQQQIVLVRGKVEVHASKLPVEVLAPNQMYEYDKQTDKTTIKNVDITDYTSWKNGYYRFKSQQLSDLFKRLSRYYAVQIVCNEKVGSLKCSGKLDLTEHLDDVLRNLSDAAPIKVEHHREQIIINYEPLK